MKAEEYRRRRHQLMRMMGRDAIAILPAAPIRRRNADTEYPYRQDSDFQFLTGSHPGALGRGSGWPWWCGQGLWSRRCFSDR